MELHPRALEIAELAAPDACTQSQRLIASQIHQAMQQAREDALEEAAVFFLTHKMNTGGEWVRYESSLTSHDAIKNAEVIRALKIQQKA